MESPFETQQIPQDSSSMKPMEFPRKEKNRKPPTGENVVPCEWIFRVNPNGGKQGGIPEKEYTGIENPKGDPSWRRTKLIMRCQRDNSNEDTSWHQKELILMR